MATENPNEGNQSIAGATQPPVAPPSTTPDQLSRDEIEALRGLPNLVKGLQKGTDKQIGQVRADVKRILELKEAGLSEAQIQRELDVDALLAQGTQTKPVVGNDSKEQSLDTAEQIRILKEADFNANTSEGLKLLSGQFHNLDQFEAAVYKEKLRLTSKPSPDVSAAPPLPSGGASQGGSDLADLFVRLDKARKFPLSQEYKDVKKKLDERGWK